MLQQKSLNKGKFALLVTQLQSFVDIHWWHMQLREQPSASKHLLTLFIKAGVELVQPCLTNNPLKIT